NDITSQTSIPFRLRSQLVQSIAMINLLIDRWYEPPMFEKLHGSTFVQQILSCVAQFGGIQALDLWVILCEKGPFKDISKDEFQGLLKSLGRENFITQASDSTLVLDVKGENVVGHYSFYAVFQTPEEYQLISSGKTLGTLPINFPVLEDSFLIFAGERWKVLKVDDDKKTIELTPAPGGNVPVFGGAGIDIHDRIREEMFDIYNQNNAPEYLNQKGKELLSERREWFRKYKLDENLVIPDGQDSLIFIWKGSVIKHTISLLLTVLDHDVMREGLALRVKETQPEEVKESFKQVAKMDVSDVELADKVKNKKTEKYDYLLTPSLLNKDY
ncbi:MAG: hypothetical protein ABEH43_05820, partial [Flavobacteriales bacterium]